MGAYVKLNSISDSDIESIREIPEKLQIVHDGEIYLDDFENLSEEQIKELSSWKTDTQPKVFHVEGANHWISYLLTEETEWNSGISPLNFLNASHNPMGELGYGSPSFYSSDETKHLANELSSLEIDQVMNRYNPEFFIKNQIGPRSYKWEETDRNSMRTRLTELIEYIKNLANENLGFYVSWE